MTTSNIKKVLTVFQGIATRDPDLTTKHIHPEQYTEHNPNAADGVAGLREYVGRLPRESRLKVVRAFEDGAYVFTQTDGQIFDQNTFFEVFRFADELIVEHWVFSATAVPANQSGHTQTDGPTEAKHLEDTAKNKAFMRDYYETFHISGDHRGSERYFKGDLCIRHEPGVRDGVTEFLRDVEAVMQHRTIDKVKFLLGQGDFVFIAAMGTHERAPCAYIDLYRVEARRSSSTGDFLRGFHPRRNAGITMVCSRSNLTFVTYSGEDYEEIRRQSSYRHRGRNGDRCRHRAPLFAGRRVCHAQRTA